MTKEQFQNKYNHYSETDEQKALSEAKKVNKEMGGDFVQAVNLDGIYCLMLNTAANFIREIGII